MKRRRTPTTTLPALVICVALVGCSSSEGGFGGGFGGGGDAGGGGGSGGVETAMLRVAHLAPGVPSTTATEVDFTLVDEGSFNAIGFGQVTQYATVPVGPRVVTVAELGGGGASLASITSQLGVDTRYTVVAYRDSREVTAVSLMLFEESTSGLARGSGRMVVGHGVDDGSWGTVNVIDSDTDEVLATGLAFGNQTRPFDWAAGDHRLGFEVALPLPMVDEGPFRVNVEVGESSILFVVDNDSMDQSVDVAVYGMGPDTIGPAAPLPRE